MEAGDVPGIKDGRKGHPSRWVTLHALQALKGYREGARL